jgi:glycerol-3-phosphate dehydrogenase
MQPGVETSRSDVLPAWTRICLLVRGSSKAKFEGLVHNYLIIKSKNGLITMAGWKWPTYRQMAEETVDEAITDFDPSYHGLNEDFDQAALPPNGDVTDLEQTITPNGASQTLGLRLISAHGWTPTLHSKLSHRFGVQPDVAKHLTTAYGNRAWQVSKLCASFNDRFVNGSRLVPHLPFLDGEVLYAVRCEYAKTITDVIARRLRLAFLDARAAESAMSVINRLLAEELGWSAQRQVL